MAVRARPYDLMALFGRHSPLWCPSLSVHFLLDKQEKVDKRNARGWRGPSRAPAPTVRDEHGVRSAGGKPPLPKGGVAERSEVGGIQSASNELPAATDRIPQSASLTSRLAVPEKPFGLTRSLRFFDRCGHSGIASSAPGGGMPQCPL